LDTQQGRPTRVVTRAIGSWMCMTASISMQLRLFWATAVK
jgi:hypothetical protein